MPRDQRKITEIVASLSTKKAPAFNFDSSDEQKLHAWVMHEVQDMQDYASTARQTAREAIQGYNSLLIGSQPGRSRLFPPLIHTLVYSRMAMEAASLPKVEYRPRSVRSEPAVKLLNAARKNAEQGDGNLRPDSLHLWFHQNFDKILLGTGFRYLSYLLQKRTIRIKDASGKAKEKTMIVYDDIWDEVPDFFHLGVSRDMLPGMFGGRACYMDKFFHRDVFQETFDTRFYKNVDKVPGSWFSGESEFNEAVPDDYVRVRYFWDLCKDLFYVLANGIPIRQDFILDYGHPDRPQKFLPLTSIHNDVNYVTSAQVPTFTDTGITGATTNTGGRLYSQSVDFGTSKSFWTKGDPKIVQPLIALKTSLWRAAADHVKASSVHFLLSQSAGVIDQIRTADLYGVVPLKTDATAFDVRSLTQGSTFLQQWQGVDEISDNLIAYALGNDWKRAAAEMTNEKATVAMIRQQVQRVRFAQNMKFNETGGIKRHYRILLNLIEQYYSEPSLMDLEDGEVPEDTLEEDIIRDGDGQPVQIKRWKKIPVDEYVVETKKKGKFSLVSSSSDDRAEKSFRARPEYILAPEEAETFVEPGSTFAELTALQRSSELEFLQVVQPLMSLVYPDENGMPKPLIPKEGAEYVLTKLAEAWERDPKKILGKSNDDDDIAKKIQPPFSFAQAFARSEAPIQTSPTGKPQPLSTSMNQDLRGMMQV